MDIDVSAITISSDQMIELMPRIDDRYKALRQFTELLMVKDVDYGLIPNTKKNQLLLPGAQKIRELFHLSIEMELVEKIEDWTGKDHEGEPFFFYLFKAQASFPNSSEKPTPSFGSCNSWEKKYRWREAKRICPNCGSDAILKSRSSGDGYFCWTKKGGCGAKFSETDDRIVNQKGGLEKNPDIYDLPNTLLRMAQKRAYVSAILYATGLTGFFADLESDRYSDREFEEESVTPRASKQPINQPQTKLESNAPQKENLIKTISTTFYRKGFSPEQEAQFIYQNFGVKSRNDLQVGQLIQLQNILVNQ